MSEVSKQNREEGFTQALTWVLLSVKKKKAYKIF